MLDAPPAAPDQPAQGHLEPAADDVENAVELAGPDIVRRGEAVPRGGEAQVVHDDVLRASDIESPDESLSE